MFFFKQLSNISRHSDEKKKKVFSVCVIYKQARTGPPGYPLHEHCRIRASEMNDKQKNKGRL